METEFEGWDGGGAYDYRGYPDAVEALEDAIGDMTLIRIDQDGSRYAVPWNWSVDEKELKSKSQPLGKKRESMTYGK